MTYKKVLEFARANRKNPTRAENFFWQKVRNRRFFGLKFNRQFIIEHESNSFFIADFFCHEYSLIIELDGEIHRFNQAYDQMREDILVQLGYHLLRFNNDQVLKDWEQVEDTIIRFLSVE